MSRITASEKMDTLEPEEVPRWLTIFLKEVKNLLNNGIRFNDNFDGAVVSVTFNQANTDTQVQTRLRRTPQDYIVLNRSANMVIYNGQGASSTGSISLRASAVGTVKLLVF